MCVEPPRLSGCQSLWLPLRFAEDEAQSGRACPFFISIEYIMNKKERKQGRPLVLCAGGLPAAWGRCCTLPTSLPPAPPNLHMVFLFPGLLQQRVFLGGSLFRWLENGATYCGHGLTLMGETNKHTHTHKTGSTTWTDTS